MNRLKVAEVCAALNAEEANYLVIGGIACILHGYIRATTDVDILIERSRENVERVLRALSTTGYGFAREWTADQVLQSPVTIIGDDPAVDLFLVAWSVKYEQAVAGAWTVDLEGVQVPVIGLDDLIATKRTGRPLDTADIEALEEIRRIRGDSRV
jgi:predicted nucleotidyltransferase